MQLLCHSRGERFLLIGRGEQASGSSQRNSMGPPEIYSLLSSLMRMPFDGRRIRSAKGRSSSRFWHATMLKERKMDARTTFSSIMAKRWPAHGYKRRTPIQTRFLTNTQTFSRLTHDVFLFHSYPFSGRVILSLSVVTNSCRYISISI